MEIKVIFEKDEDGVYVVTCPSLPGCVSQGRTEKEALKNIGEAIRLHVKCLAEDGLPLSRPKGSHIHLRHPQKSPLTVPNHREIARGTLRTIIRDAGLSLKGFDDLLRR